MASKEHHGPKRGEKRTLRKRGNRQKTEKVREEWSDEDVKEEMAKEDEEGGNEAKVEESAFDATCDDQEEFLKLLKQNQAFRLFFSPSVMDHHFIPVFSVV